MIWFTTESTLNLPRAVCELLPPSKTYRACVGEKQNVFGLRQSNIGPISFTGHSALILGTLSHKTYAYMLEPRISLAAVVVSFWCTYLSARFQQRGAAVVILSGENDSLRTCIQFSYFHAFFYNSNHIATRVRGRRLSIFQSATF